MIHCSGVKKIPMTEKMHEHQFGRHLDVLYLLRQSKGYAAFQDMGPI